MSECLSSVWSTKKSVSLLFDALWASNGERKIDVYHAKKVKFILILMTNFQMDQAVYQGETQDFRAGHVMVLVTNLAVSIKNKWVPEIQLIKVCHRRKGSYTKNSCVCIMMSLLISNFFIYSIHIHMWPSHTFTYSTLSIDPFNTIYHIHHPSIQYLTK